MELVRYDAGLELPGSWIAMVPDSVLTYTTSYRFPSIFFDRLIVTVASEDPFTNGGWPNARIHFPEYSQIRRRHLQYRSITDFATSGTRQWLAHLQLADRQEIGPEPSPLGDHGFRPKCLPCNQEAGPMCATKASGVRLNPTTKPLAGRLAVGATTLVDSSELPTVAARFSRCGPTWERTGGRHSTGAVRRSWLISSRSIVRRSAETWSSSRECGGWLNARHPRDSAGYAENRRAGGTRKDQGGDFRSCQGRETIGL